MNKSELERRMQIWSIICKNPKYPCQYCRNPRGEQFDCNDNNCPKWQMWFSEEWGKIKKIKKAY